MKVECKIKRTGGTEVELRNNADGFDTVKFAPLDATRADSPHVADVTEEQAAVLFQADARVYVPFSGAAPKAAATIHKPQAPAPASETPAADSDDEDEDEDEAGDTNGDGVLSVRELKAGIADGTLKAEQLREILEKEQQSESPRQSFIAVIVKALK